MCSSKIFYKADRDSDECYTKAYMAKKSIKAAAKKAAEQTRLTKFLPLMLLIGGVIGTIASLILTYDQVQIWKDPTFIPQCSINPILSCGSVINSEQGYLFGIPGPFFGLITFPVLATVGAAMLAGARMKRWFWLGMQAGAIGGVGYALWLFWLSLFTINALCPFCLTVDVVVYVLAWYITLYNIEHGHIKVPAKLRPLSRFARKHHLDIILFVLLAITGYILYHFWYYFGQFAPF